MKSKLLSLLLCLGLLSSPLLHGREQARGARAETKGEMPAWQYTGERGAHQWGKLSSAYAACSEGKRQSPIDLQPSRYSRLPVLRFLYRSGPLHLINDGRTLRLGYPRGSQLSIGQRRLDLQTVVFHTPAEHSLDGQRADMEIQLMHVDGAGKRVNLAIPVVVGSRRNAMLERIADYLPEGARSGERHFRNVGINPTFFLPSDRRYYRYSGSLTQPPCSEQVSWLVLQQPLEVTADLVARFHRVTGDNNRPLQPLAGRQVTASR
jgi:carbonic anhydrase